MIHISKNIRLKRPPSRVFEFLQDPHNYTLWQITMEKIQATDGMQVGSRITYTRTSEMGERVKGAIRISKNNGRDLLESESVGGLFDTRVRFDLEPAGPHTLFKVDIKSIPLSPLPPDAESTIKYVFGLRTESDLRRLQSVLENK